MKKNIKQNKKEKKEFDKRNIELINVFSQKAVAKEMVKIEELENHFSISNRNAREKVSEMSMHHAIISLTQEKGYELLLGIDNYSNEELLIYINKIEHQINDFQSRIKFLKKRMKPLIAWKKVAEKHLNGE